MVKKFKAMLKFNHELCAANVQPGLSYRKCQFWQWAGFFYFSLMDYFATNYLFGRSWVKKIVDKGEYNQCPHCTRLIFKEDT